MESTNTLRFDSLGDIRKEQTRIQHLRRAARGQVVVAEPGITPIAKEDALPSSLREEILAFVLRTEATGALLSDEAERWTAQGVLDYWTDVLERAGAPRPAGVLAPFDPQQLPEIPDDKCPFVGLDAFGESQASRFFGRSAAIQDLLGFVEHHRLVAVVGPSGSGKSSLVCAGLVPLLRAAAERGATPWQILPTIVPGEAPDDALRALLGDALAGNSAASSAERLLALGSGKRLLLIVDQFEELFTVCESDEKRRAFASELVRLTTAPHGQHTVILTIRSDFEQQIAALPELHALYPAGRFALGVMMEDELREAIEKPARAVNLRFEEGLVKQILRDVSAESAALPLLQFTLLQLWKRRRGNLVLRESYDALHGAAGAVTEVADEVFRNLKLPEKQDVARRIFLRLTYPKEGRFDVFRQRLRRAEIIRDERADYAEEVIRDFVSARLLRRVQGQTADSEQIEVAHEALVRNWQTLLGWLEDSKHDVVTRRRLDFMVEEWIRLGEAEAGCLDAVQLREAKDWVSSDKAKLHGYHRRLPDLIARSSALVEEASKREARQRRRMQLFVLSLSGAIGAVAIVASLVYAWNNRQETALRKREASIVNQQSQLRSELASAQQKTMQALRLMRENPLKALRLVSEVSRASHYESRTMLYRVLGQPLPKAKLSGHSAAINRVEVSPQGDFLLTASEDKTVRLWNFQGSTLSLLSCHTQGVNGARFHPQFSEHRELLTYGDDAKLLRWTLSDTKQWEATDVKTGAPASCLRRDASLSVVQQRAGNDPSLLEEASAETKPIVWAEWSPDGKFIAYRDDARVLRYVSASDSQQKGVKLEDAARAFFLPAEGATLVWQDSEDGVHLCNLEDCQPVKIGAPGQEFRSLERLSGREGIATFGSPGKTPDKRSATPKSTATQPEPSVIWAYDRSGQPRLGVAGFRHEDLLSVSDVSWSPDGKLLLTISRSAAAPMTDALQLWRIERGVLVKVPWGASTIPIPPSLPLPPQSASRASAASTQRPGPSFAAPRGTARPTTQPSKSIFQAQFSPDGRYIVACDKERKVMLYERTSAEQGYRVSAVLGPFVRMWNRCGFSGDGKWVLLGNVGEPGMQVWDTAGHFVVDIGDGFPVPLPRTGYYLTQTLSQERILWSFERPSIPMLVSAQGNVNLAATDRNETKLVTASGNTLFLWTDKGEQAGRTRTFADPVLSLDMSEDGQRVLAVTGFPSRCWLWNLASDSEPVFLESGSVSTGCFFFHAEGKVRIGGLIQSGEVVQWTDGGERLPSRIDPKLVGDPATPVLVTISFPQRGSFVIVHTHAPLKKSLMFDWNGKLIKELPRQSDSYLVDTADQGDSVVILDGKELSRFDGKGNRLPLLVPDVVSFADKPVLAMSETGRYIAASDSSGVWVWDTKLGAAPRHLAHSAAVRKILIHETVEALATETERNQVLIWSLSSAQELPQRRSTGRLLAVASESPACKTSARPWLFTQDRDGTLLMWHVREGEHRRFASLREDWSISDVFVSPSLSFVVPTSNIRYSVDSSRRIRVSHRWPLDEAILHKLTGAVLSSHSQVGDADEALEKDELQKQLQD